MSIIKKMHVINNKHKDKPMTTIPDLGQAHETRVQILVTRLYTALYENLFAIDKTYNKPLNCRINPNIADSQFNGEET